jgi:hypothetical protein
VGGHLAVADAALDFATLLRRLMQARPDQYAALQVKIEGTKLLAGKTWFLKVLGRVGVM